MQLLKNHVYDLIILDYQMPGMDGLETIQAIKLCTNKKIKQIPVVLLTGEINNLKLKDLEKSGVKYFIRKPIQANEFSFTISQLLKNQEKASQKGVVSTKYLNRITNANKSLMVEIIDVFIEEAPNNFHQLKSYYILEDWTNLMKLLHKIKANYTYVGIKEHESLIRDFELDLDRLLNVETYFAKIVCLEEITNRSLIDLNKKRKSLISKIQD
jgi:CheY-like chemotaxis protein